MYWVCIFRKEKCAKSKSFSDMRTCFLRIKQTVSVLKADFKGISTGLQRRGRQWRWPIIAKASPSVVNGYWRLDLPTGGACHFPIFPPIDFTCFYTVMARDINPFFARQASYLEPTQTDELPFNWWTSWHPHISSINLTKFQFKQEQNTVQINQLASDQVKITPFLLPCVCTTDSGIFQTCFVSLNTHTHSTLSLPLSVYWLMGAMLTHA